MNGCYESELRGGCLDEAVDGCCESERVSGEEAARMSGWLLLGWVDGCYGSKWREGFSDEWTAAVKMIQCQDGCHH